MPYRKMNREATATRCHTWVNYECKSTHFAVACDTPRIRMSSEEVLLIVKHVKVRKTENSSFGPRCPQPAGRPVWVNVAVIVDRTPPPSLAAHDISKASLSYLRRLYLSGVPPREGTSACLPSVRVVKSGVPWESTTAKCIALMCLP